MDGNEVYRFATRVMAQATREALEIANIELEDVNWIIPHQANIRIIAAAARGLKIPMERFVVNLDRYGNTSTASIPIATVEAAQDGRLKAGDKIAFVGFGGGLTWGAFTAEWTGPLPSEKKFYPRRYRLWARIRSFMLRVIRSIEGIIWGRGS
jgi:3-oxoacyl-[acyl-carrier-protein] synthase III